MSWPNNTKELGEFFLVFILCVLPALFIVMNITNILSGVFH